MSAKSKLDMIIINTMCNLCVDAFRIKILRILAMALVKQKNVLWQNNNCNIDMSIITEPGFHSVFTISKN